MTTVTQNQPLTSPAVAPITGIPRDVRAAIDGTIGGVIGAVPMSVAMLAARRMGLMGRQPPERITQKIFFRGKRRPRNADMRNRVASLLHFAFGGAVGAVFGVMQRRLPHRANPAFTGLLFGAFVWATSYLGWLPALGLMPYAHRERPDRPIVMVVVHLIFGATLGAVVGWLGRFADTSEVARHV
jgi:TctA family transporter